MVQNLGFSEISCFWFWGSVALWQDEWEAFLDKTDPRHCFPGFYRAGWEQGGAGGRGWVNPKP